MIRYRRIAGIAILVGAFAVGAGLFVRLRVAGQETPQAEPDPGASPGNGSPERHGAKPNRLVDEKSPYLLQHAYNPDDWYPWGSAAFEKARKESKPIFLSVGYSTCHWCHVMERESFSSPEIAAVMNRHFVSIKVDREERPDVDRVYMTFVQATTGSGGWPMSVFLTPELKPFWGGTYFPPDARNGMPGFRDILSKVAEQWESNREAIVASAGRVTEALKNLGGGQADGNLKLDRELLDRTYQWYASAYDPQDAGFEAAPKFPRPVNFNFLLRYYARTGQKKALEMTTQTLRQMARGGVHDHIGGGFHRYSTDKRWFAPHFEKMLYDQAQLAVSYLEAYQLTRDSFLAEIARDIFEYVLRDMTGPEGGFYSAEDADSPVGPANREEQAEGAFYVWSRQEIADLLGKDAAIVEHYYGVKENGNVERDPFGEFQNKNILHVAAGLEETAQEFGKPASEVRKILSRSREILFQARAKRPRPHRDDKILTAWNGLMISALSKGYQVLQEERYRKAAERAASFVAAKLLDKPSKLLKRRYREGEAAIEGMIDDYAFFTQGLLDLYETSLDGRWLVTAIELTETQNRLFWDAGRGGFYNTTDKDPSILIRMKEDYDGAEPSPNSVAVLNLLRLSQMSDNKKWHEMAEKSIQAFGKRLAESPQAMPQMMVAVDFHLDKPRQILIAGDSKASDTQAIAREVHRRFIPNKIVVLVDGGAAQQRLAATLDVLNSLRRIDGKATAYICENYVCHRPTNDLAVVAELLDGKRAL
ncbi:MAG: thioredoxin domain-containing protein [Acidobacteria bacterium]|nr:thioredoxin domain-containing protein [Acidobacteriota bacterium]